MKIKRLIASAALVACLAAPARAEIDLSGMSFAELVDLQQQITAAIMQTDEWQEVKVPSGFYEIGRDIPAGRWTLRPAGGSAYVAVHETYADALADEATIFGEAIFDDDEYVIEVDEGMGLELSGAVYFTPYTASFSFK